jgi:hypothetical protein
MVDDCPPRRNGLRRGRSKRRPSIQARLLAYGMVLVAGGFNGEGWLRDAELYEPARGRWKRVAPMTIPREHASASCSAMAACWFAGCGDAGDVYSPATGTSTATGPRI